MTYDKGSWGTYAWDPSKTREENLLSAERLGAAVTKSKMDNIEDGIADAHIKNRELEQVKADKVELQELDNKKADNNRVDSLEQEKADITYVESMAEGQVNNIDFENARREDKNYVGTEIDKLDKKKADKDKLEEDIGNVTAQLAQKATKGNIGLSDLDKNKTKYDASWFSNDFLTELANNEINTTYLEDDSVTTNKLVDRSVTVNKTDFVKSSKNMVGEANLIADVTISSSGRVDRNSLKATSYFIPVQPNTTYSFTRITEFSQYDSNKNFIHRTQRNQTSINSLTTRPETAFVRVSLRKEDVDVAQMNQGSSLSEYSVYSPTIIDEDKISGKNMVLTKENVDFITTPVTFVGEETLINKGYVNRGTFHESDKYVSSELIRVHEDETFTFKGFSSVSSYDENGEYIRDDTFSSNTTYTTSVQSGVSFLIFSANVEYLDVAQANKGFKLLPKGVSSKPYLDSDLIKDKSIKGRHISDELNDKISEQAMLKKIAFSTPRIYYPKPMLVITYDDNPVTDYTLAFPVHQKYGVPGEVAVVTDFLTGRMEKFASFSHPSVSIEELKEMQSAGWEISTHTKTHRTVGMHSFNYVPGPPKKGDYHWYVGAFRNWQAHETALPFTATVFDMINPEITQNVKIIGTGLDETGREYLISETPSQFDFNLGTSYFTASYETLYEEIVESALELNQLGFKTNSIAYPYNENSNWTREIVGKHLLSGRSGTSRHIDNYMDGIEGYIPTQRLLAYPESSRWSEQEIDDMLDQLVEKNALGMIFEHSWATNFNPEGLDYLIAAAIEKGVEITTRTEALKHHGNRVESGDLFNEPVEDTYIVNALGKEFINPRGYS